jgi:hypothetical protein
MTQWLTGIILGLSLLGGVCRAEGFISYAQYLQGKAAPDAAIVNTLLPAPVVMVIGQTEAGHYPVLLCRASLQLAPSKKPVTTVYSLQHNEHFRFQVVDVKASPLLEKLDSDAALPGKCTWSVTGIGGAIVTVNTTLPMDLAFLVLAIPNQPSTRSEADSAEAKAALENALANAKKAAARVADAEETHDLEDVDKPVALSPMLTHLIDTPLIFDKALGKGKHLLTAQSASPILLATQAHDKPLKENKLLGILHPVPQETAERKIYRMEFDIPAVSQFFLKKFGAGSDE